MINPPGTVLVQMALVIVPVVMAALVSDVVAAGVEDLVAVETVTAAPA